MTDKKEDPKYTIEFAPGAFNSFEGTQEELDEMIAELTAMAETGELFENSEPVDLDELFDQDPQAAMQIANAIGLFDDFVDEDGNEVTLAELKKVMGVETKRTLN